MRHHRGLLIQRGTGLHGAGLGSFFKTAFNFIKPFFRTATKSIARVGKAALKNPIVRDTVQELGQGAIDVGLSTVSDLAKGQNLADTWKIRVKTLKRN